MKKFALYLILAALFPPFVSVAQTSSGPIKISKLVIDSRKSFGLIAGDSVAAFIIDTLIMKDKAKLFLVNKKQASLVIHHAVIGKDCLVEGNDGKNNGTNLHLAANFVQLRSLSIDVSGEDARMANRHYDNGNGGQVVVSYLASGKKPQTSDKRQSQYLAISNKGGGHLVNPQGDIRVLMDQLRNGYPGRPLAQLPQGRVYSGGIGADGKATVKPVTSLPN